MTIFPNAHAVSFHCSLACSWNKSRWNDFPLNSFDFWDKNKWMRPEYIQVNFAKLELASISNLLMALWAKYTGYNVTFTLVDILKWLSHLKNDLKNCLENISHLYCFINGKLLKKKKEWLKNETWRLRDYEDDQENSHDSGVPGTAWCSDTETQRVGLGSTNPGTHPANMSRNVIFDASQWEESHSSYKSIFIKFSQMFNSI